jgi:hypothetical protein
VPPSDRQRLQALAIAETFRRTNVQLKGAEAAARDTARIEAKVSQQERQGLRRLVVRQVAATTGRKVDQVEAEIVPQMGLFGLGAIAAAIAPTLIKGAVGLGRQVIGGAPTVVRRLPGAAAAIGGAGAAAGYQLSQSLTQPVAIAPAPVGSYVPPAGNGMATDKMGRPLLVQVEYQQRAKCPSGYVAVMYNGAKVCMLKSCARSYGWKPKQKPVISNKDWNALKRADGAAKRVRIVARKADRVTGRSRRTSRTTAAPAARRRRTTRK